MKKIFQYVAVLLLVLFLCISGLRIWYGDLEYYWYSKSLTLYQKDGIVRLCNETQPLSPSWNASSENRKQLEKAAVYVKSGLPVTILGRGGISKSTSEVHIDRINSIESGVNSKCEKAR
jgi:hypothetical protein